jgi:hypothetical protein
MHPTLLFYSVKTRQFYLWTGEPLVLNGLTYHSIMSNWTVWALLYSKFPCNRSLGSEYIFSIFILDCHYSICIMDIFHLGRIWCKSCGQGIDNTSYFECSNSKSSGLYNFVGMCYMYHKQPKHSPWALVLIILYYM